jgi:hypothetical protein
MDLLHFWDGEGLTGIDVVGGVFTLKALIVEIMSTLTGKLNLMADGTFTVTFC